MRGLTKRYGGRAVVDAVALQVGAEARAAGLGTRSIKTTAKAHALDLAIRMVDLTTLEGADTPGKVRGLATKALVAKLSALVCVLLVSTALAAHCLSLCVLSHT